MKAWPRRSRTRAAPVPPSSFISTLSHSQLPQTGPYGPSEPRVSPSLANRNVLAPHQPQSRVTQSESAGAGTRHLRVPRWRGSLRHRPRGQRCGPPQAPRPRQEAIAGGRRQGGSDAPLLPGALAALAPAAVALGGPGPPSRTRGCCLPARHRALL